MSTRQLRLNDPGVISSRIRDFLGRRIQLVLTNNTSFFGELDRVEGTAIILENMRKKKITYSLSSISEIYIDAIS